MFVIQRQNYWNDRLKRKGHVFLNEVRESLGLDRVPEGQMVGWIYDPNDSERDNYIDFGIYDVYSEANRRFANGLERSVLIDVNVDGTIYDKI